MDQDLMSDDDFLDVDTDDDMPSLASEDAFGSDAESYAGGRHQDLLSDVSSVLGDQDLLSDVSSVLGDPVPAVLPDVLAVPAVLPDVKPKRLSRKEMAVHIKLGKARFAKLNYKVNRIMKEQAAQLSEFSSLVKRRGRRATLLVKKKTKRCRTTGLKVSVRWKGQRTARDVCYTTMREIAYDKDNMHLKPLAASFSLSHPWVATLQLFVANNLPNVPELAGWSVAGAVCCPSASVRPSPHQVGRNWGEGHAEPRECFHPRADTWHLDSPCGADATAAPTRRCSPVERPLFCAGHSQRGRMADSRIHYPYPACS